MLPLLVAFLLSLSHKALRRPCCLQINSNIFRITRLSSHSWVVPNILLLILFIMFRYMLLLPRLDLLPRPDLSLRIDLLYLSLGFHFL